MIDKKEIFIFDFDNTIIESLPLCFSCFRIVFEKYKNIKMSDSDIESLFGGSEEDIIRSHVEENMLMKQSNYFTFFMKIYTIILLFKIKYLKILLCY